MIDTKIWYVQIRDLNIYKMTKKGWTHKPLLFLLVGLPGDWKFLTCSSSLQNFKQQDHLGSGP